MSPTLGMGFTVSGPHHVLERRGLAVPSRREGDEAGLLSTRRESMNINWGVGETSRTLPAGACPETVINVLGSIATPRARLVIAPSAPGTGLLGEDRASEDGAENPTIPRFQSVFENRDGSFAVEWPWDRQVLANLHSVPNSPTGCLTNFVAEGLPRRKEGGERAPIGFPRVPGGISRSLREPTNSETGPRGLRV